MAENHSCRHHKFMSSFFVEMQNAEFCNAKRVYMLRDNESVCLVGSGSTDCILQDATV